MSITEHTHEAVICQSRNTGQLFAAWYSNTHSKRALIATNATPADLGRTVRVRITSSLTCEIVQAP